MLGSYTEAEDMLQETFLRAVRSISAFEGRSSARAWLYRIASRSPGQPKTRFASARRSSMSVPDSSASRRRIPGETLSRTPVILFSTERCA
ncbi:MAG: sigma factor, partial [Acidimicrobiia bacterium]